MYACDNEQIATAKLLIAKGANIEAKGVVRLGCACSLLRGLCLGVVGWDVSLSKVCVRGCESTASWSWS
jgi:hypothetical protein